MAGYHFPYIPLNMRGDFVRKSVKRMPTISPSTKRGPCDMIRRYPNGILDFEHAAQQIVEVAERTRDLNQAGRSNFPLTSSERALLTLITGAKLGIPKQVASTMMRLTKKEENAIRARVAQLIAQKQGWNAGFGGGLSPSAVDKSMEEEVAESPLGKSQDNGDLEKARKPLPHTKVALEHEDASGKDHRMMPTHRRYGQYAVHDSVKGDGRYGVTHTPTGLEMETYEKKSHAYHMARHYHENAPEHLNHLGFGEEPSQYRDQDRDHLTDLVAHKQSGETHLKRVAQRKAKRKAEGYVRQVSPYKRVEQRGRMLEHGPGRRVRSKDESRVGERELELPGGKDPGMPYSTQRRGRGDVHTAHTPHGSYHVETTSGGKAYANYTPHGNRPRPVYGGVFESVDHAKEAVEQHHGGMMRGHVGRRTRERADMLETGPGRAVSSKPAQRTRELEMRGSTGEHAPYRPQQRTRELELPGSGTTQEVAPVQAQRVRKLELRRALARLSGLMNKGMTDEEKAAEEAVRHSRLFASAKKVRQKKSLNDDGKSLNAPKSKREDPDALYKDVAEKSQFEDAIEMLKGSGPYKRPAAGWQSDEHGGAGRTTAHGRYEIGQHGGGHYVLYAPHGGTSTETVATSRRSLQDAKDIAEQHHFAQQGRVTTVAPGEASGTSGLSWNVKPRMRRLSVGSGTGRAYGAMEHELKHSLAGSFQGALQILKANGKDVTAAAQTAVGQARERATGASDAPGRWQRMLNRLEPGSSSSPPPSRPSDQAAAQVRKKQHQRVRQLGLKRRVTPGVAKGDKRMQPQRPELLDLEEEQQDETE